MLDLDHSPTRHALDLLDREFGRFIEDLVTLAEIPAPPFVEDQRAVTFAELLRADWRRCFHALPTENWTVRVWSFHSFPDRGRSGNA